MGRKFKKKRKIAILASNEVHQIFDHFSKLHSYNCRNFEHFLFGCFRGPFGFGDD
jgi:hypothetical protein